MRSRTLQRLTLVSSLVLAQQAFAEQVEDLSTTSLAPTAAVELPERQLVAKGFAASVGSAMNYDPGLRVAYANYLAEQQDDDLSFAELLPQVNVSVSYQYEDSNNIYTDEDSNFFDPELPRSGGELLDTTWRVDVSQKLFDLEAYRSYERDQALVQSSEFRYQRSVQQAIYTIAESYLAVLLLAQRVYLNEQKLQALELKKRQADRANELGVGDQLSVLRVTASRDLARSDLLQASSELTDAKTRLKNLTGEEVVIPAGWVEGAQDIDWYSLAILVQDLNLAVANNLQLREAEQKILQENLNLSAQRSGHAPKVTLNISHQDRQSEDNFRERKDTSVQLQLRMPIYSGGRQSALVKKAEARLQASQAEYDLVLAQKQQQVDLSLNLISSITERLDALQESKRSSEGYLNAAERQVSLNLGDQIAVLDARADLVDTQLEFAQTLHDFLLADLVLRLETGVLKASHLAEYDSLYSAAAITEE